MSPRRYIKGLHVEEVFVLEKPASTPAVTNAAQLAEGLLDQELGECGKHAVRVHNKRARVHTKKHYAWRLHHGVAEELQHGVARGVEPDVHEVSWGGTAPCATEPRSFYAVTEAWSDGLSMVRGESPRDTQDAQRIPCF